MCIHTLIVGLQFANFQWSFVRPDESSIPFWGNKTLRVYWRYLRLMNLNISSTLNNYVIDATISQTATAKKQIYMNPIFIAKKTYLGPESRL